MQLIFRVIVSIGLMNAFTATDAFAERDLTFESNGAALSGVLLVNFVMLTGSGEMLKGHILYLDGPITIAGNENSSDRRNRKTVRGIQKILLEFADSTPIVDMAGARVEVIGKLINAPSDPHHTKVLMVVDEINLLSAPEDEQPVATFKTHK